MNFFNSKLRITTTFLAFLIVSVFSVSTSIANDGGKNRSCKKQSRHNHEQNKQDCGENPFSSEIVSIEEEGECLIYKIKVTSSTQICRFDLSHFMFDPGCGTIVEAYNSGNWKMEFNVTDPKTQVTGLKVDDISGFGKNPWFDSFYVKLKVCPDESCETELSCAEPKVAYKAGQCIYFEDFEAECSEETAELSVEFEKIDPACFGSSDGSIALHITGGEKPYTISWNTGQADSVLSNLVAGDYSYLITDAQGSTLEQTISLSSPDEVVIGEELIQPGCAGTNTGSINVSATGGSGNFTFQWGTGETTASIIDKPAGYYSVEVTDENGCSASKSYILENQAAIAITPHITQPSCGGEPFGTIELEVTGGTAPYTFLWDDSSTEQNRYELEEGRYVVTVSDQNGCELSASYDIELTSPINIIPNVTHTNCLDDAIGAIELSVSGGEEPYTYKWSNGGTSQNISGLNAGKYSVLVTDASGCTATYDINIISMALSVYASQTSIPVCPGDPSASIDVTVFFGTEPLTFEWSNGATTEDLTGITSGTYSVTVTDGLGCSATRTIEVKDQNPISINYNVAVNGCAEAPEYNVTTSVTGGDGNYSYLWSNGSTSSSTTFDTPGTYSIEVTDGNGCTQTSDVLVEGEPGSPSCLINGLAAEIMCGSEGNTLFTSIDGAVSFDWDVSSSDGSWTITSSSDLSEITFTAGNEGTTATFFLEVLLETGCTAICALDVSTCAGADNPDNPDGGSDNPNDGSDNPDGGSDNPDNGSDNPDSGSDNPDDGSDNPDGGSDNPDNGSDNPDGGSGNPDDGSDNPDGGGDNPDDGGGNPDDGSDGTNDDNECTDCFFAKEVEITRNGQYFDYNITINHNNQCHFDLSHLVVNLPECAWLEDYSNSMGWKMEQVYHDNKTGASGIKVDDIPSFGKDDLFTSFEISFTLKSYDDQCIDALACFAPEIAYKAGQCVQYEQTSSTCAEGNGEETNIITYPNPTHDWVNVCFDKDDQDYSIDLYDMYGKKVHHRDRKGGWGEENCEINLSNYTGSIFYLHVSGDDGYLKTFKLCKK